VGGGISAQSNAGESLVLLAGSAPPDPLTH
jgi:hypothetical protein